MLRAAQSTLTPYPNKKRFKCSAATIQMQCGHYSKAVRPLFKYSAATTATHNYLRYRHWYRVLSVFRCNRFCGLGVLSLRQPTFVSCYWPTTISESVFGFPSRFQWLVTVALLLSDLHHLPLPLVKLLRFCSSAFQVLGCYKHSLL